MSDCVCQQQQTSPARRTTLPIVLLRTWSEASLVKALYADREASLARECPVQYFGLRVTIDPEPGEAAPSGGRRIESWRVGWRRSGKATVVWMQK